MRHRLRINVSKKPWIAGEVTCRSVPIRERLLRLLFGNEQRVTVLIPGGSIDEITICETEEGEKKDG